MNIAIIENGIVSNVLVVPDDYATDENGWRPADGQTVVTINDSDAPHIGLGYADGVFEQPPAPVVVPPTAAEILVANSATRDSLLANASVAIAPLQMAVSLGEATDAETASAKAWVAYSRAVKSVDLTQASPTWPVVPTA